MRSLLRSVFGILIGILFAWAPLEGRAQEPAPPSTTPTVDSVASIELPPQLDRVLRDYERLWAANAMDSLAAIFAPDGFILQSRRQPVSGRAAIAAAYRGRGGPLYLRAFDYAMGDSVA